MTKLTAVLLALLLTACAEKEPEVPQVPEVEDTANIVVNGERLTAREFRDRYCEKAPLDNVTCARVGKQVRMDSTRGSSMPKW